MKGHTMKKIIAMLSLICLVPAFSQAQTSVYKITMSLKVPRVYDNMQSLGYRKMNQQKITGYVYVDYDAVDGEPRITTCCFVNNTHKINGKKVTYSDSSATEVMWRYIGSNKTNVFKNTNVKFCLDLDPSYNIGSDEPDNTLVITLAGYGKNEKVISGNVTGQIGCGCKAYGHVSPTRTIECNVSDIVPLYGSFKMKLVGTGK